MTGMELKIKRIVNGIAAKEIAEMLGVSKGYISLMEKGDRNIPSEKLEKWTQYLEGESK